MALPDELPQGGPIEVRGEDFTEMVRKMLAAPAAPLPPRKKKQKPTE